MTTEFENWYWKEWPEIHRSPPTWPSHEETAAFKLYDAGPWRGEGTSFPDFFRERWTRMVDECLIPSEALTWPPAAERRPDDHSWWHRAAWLVYSMLRRQGKTLSEASDLFG
jgi:hypothetical protein